MKLYRIVTGRLSSNAYFLADEISKKAVCIDCGEDYDAVKAAEKQYGFKITYLLLTHAHFDHAGAAKDLQDDGVKVYISEKDAPKLNNDLNLAKYMGVNFKPLKPDVTLKDCDVLRINGLNIRVIATPGHTSGSVTFMVGDMLFTGDTLFCGSCGRTDLKDGNPKDMSLSLKKLFSIKGDYRVFPGHEMETTLQREREFNPFSELSQL